MSVVDFLADFWAEIYELGCPPTAAGRLAKFMGPKIRKCLHAPRYSLVAPFSAIIRVM
jgi:hypothetical protein